MRILGDQQFQLAAVGDVIAVAQQDQAIGLHAVLVIGMPVVGELLERHEQVLAVARRSARHRPEDRQEERVDAGGIGSRVLEQQQRQRTGALGAQRRSMAIDLVIELAHSVLDPPAGLRTDQVAAGQDA